MLSAYAAGDGGGGRQDMLSAPDGKRGELRSSAPAADDTWDMEGSSR